VAGGFENVNVYSGPIKRRNTVPGVGTFVFVRRFCTMEKT